MSCKVNTLNNKSTTPWLEESVWPLFSSYCHGSIFQGNASCNYLSSSLYQMTMHPFIKMLAELYSTGGNKNLVDFMHSEFSSYWECTITTEHAQCIAEPSVVSLAYERVFRQPLNSYGGERP